MTTSTTPDPAGARPAALRVIFLHHSVGRFLIRWGGVRDLWAEHNAAAGTRHELWDHDYNAVGLSGPDGAPTGASFAIPDDNTEPAGFAALFSQPVQDPPDNALSRLLEYDVIVFKSCYPACHIRSNAQLAEYQRAYETVRATIARYPGKLFVA